MRTCSMNSMIRITCVMSTRQQQMTNNKHHFCIQMSPNINPFKGFSLNNPLRDSPLTTL
jgi:hypothetical protein